MYRPGKETLYRNTLRTLTPRGRAAAWQRLTESRYHRCFYGDCSKWYSPATQAVDHYWSPWIGGQEYTGRLWGWNTKDGQYYEEVSEVSFNSVCRVIMWSCEPLRILPQVKYCTLPDLTELKTEFTPTRWATPLTPPEVPPMTSRAMSRLPLSRGTRMEHTYVPSLLTLVTGTVREASPLAMPFTATPLPSVCPELLE